MTAVVPPMLRTLDEAPALPSMTDPAWDNPETVWRIAMRLHSVDDVAHALAHPEPVHECPFCPPAAGEVPERGSEQYVRERAERPAVWSGVAA